MIRMRKRWEEGLCYKFLVLDLQGINFTEILNPLCPSSQGVCGGPRPILCMGCGHQHLRLQSVLDQWGRNRDGRPHSLQAEYSHWLCRHKRMHRYLTLTFLVNSFKFIFLQITTPSIEFVFNPVLTVFLWFFQHYLTATSMHQR